MKQNMVNFLQPILHLKFSQKGQLNKIGHFTAVLHLVTLVQFAIFWIKLHDFCNIFQFLNPLIC